MLRDDFHVPVCVIAHLHHGWVLRRLIESTQYTSEAFRRLLQGLGVTCSMSLAGNVWDNSVMESFFSTLRTEPTHSRLYPAQNAACAELFDFIERSYSSTRRHFTLVNIISTGFEQAGAVQ